MYHPNYFEESSGIRECLDRLLCLKPFIKEGSTIMDIGCSDGYFCFALDHQLSCDVTGIDIKEEIIENNKQVCKDYESDVKFLVGDVLMFQAPLATEVDTILLMSVWHHIILQHDWMEANALLKNISKSCNQLIFDMGMYGEECTDYSWHEKLPPGWDQELARYLIDNTVFENIEVIGASVVHNCDRPLFRLWKE